MISQAEKKLVYLTEAEYKALLEEEKGRDSIVYNIITSKGGFTK